LVTPKPPKHNGEEMINAREKKCAALALDPGAKEGEIDAAACAFFRSLRARGIIASQFDLTPGASVKNNELRFYFPNWGKHAGLHFDQIDPSYLRWVRRIWYTRLDDEGKEKWSYLMDEIEEYFDGHH